MQENVKSDLQFIEEIRQRPCTADNIVNVCLYPSSYIPENLVNLSLDVGNRVDIAYDWDLEDFLVAKCNDGEHITMVRV